jgi:hypothetical protein
MSNIASNQWYESMLDQPLVDLGDHEAAGFRGVLTPQGEIGQQRKGGQRRLPRKCGSLL